MPIRNMPCGLYSCRRSLRPACGGQRRSSPGREVVTPPPTPFAVDDTASLQYLLRPDGRLPPYSPPDNAVDDAATASLARLARRNGRVNAGNAE
jgi:hypothetical protein